MYSLRLIPVTVLLLLVAGRPALPGAADGFTMTPWRVASASHGRLIPLPKHDASEFLYRHFVAWAPPPDAAWRPAPGSGSLEFRRSSDPSCEEKAVFYYFRTTLDVPAAVDRRSIRLTLTWIDDGLAVFVNGSRVWQTLQSVIGQTVTVPLGPSVRTGPNTITLLLADWCILGELRGGTFTATTRTGQPVTAALATGPSEETAAPTVQLHSLRTAPASSASTGSGDDWLRLRRDASNTAHSEVALHLAPRLAWSFPLSVSSSTVWAGDDATPRATPGEARIRGDLAYAFDGNRTLVAVELENGRERWRLSDIAALGDVTEDGRIAVLRRPASPSDGSAPDPPVVALLDAVDGREQWRRPFPDPVAPLAIHQGILYFFDRQEGLQRINLADGSVMPTTTAPIHAWSLPAFTGDQILFGDYEWLYALSLVDPQRGTKFYAGGMNPIVAGPYVLASGWPRGNQVFRREGKWLRQVSYDDHHWGRFQCWLTGGAFGAGVVDSLALYDAATGQARWQVSAVEPFGGTTGWGPPRNEREDREAPDALAMGTLIVREEQRPADFEEWLHSTDRRSVLAARDGATGQLLWESEAWAGRPLAASKGYLLVAGDTSLFCLH